MALLSAANSVSMQNALDKSSDLITSADTNLRMAISSMSANPTSVDLINLQQQFQVWSLAVSTVTNMNKELADTLKSIPPKF